MQKWKISFLNKSGLYALFFFFINMYNILNVYYLLSAISLYIFKSMKNTTLKLNEHKR